MGKKKTNGEYNDFTEDTRYQTNNDIRTTLQSSSPLTRDVLPSTSSTPAQHRNTTHANPKAKKPPLTHFLCLPLVTPTNRARLSQALSELKTDVQRLTPVPPNAVRPVNTLHLTLGVMSLSPDQLTAATAYLHALDLAKLLRGITTQRIAALATDTRTVSEGFGAVQNPAAANELCDPALGADPERLVVELRGLVAMQSKRETSVLYAEPRDGSGRVVQFGEGVRRGFEERGWVLGDARSLKLHATVVNTVYARPKLKPKPKRGKGEGEGREDKSAAGAEMDAGGQGADGEVEKPREGSTSDAGSWMRFDASSLIDAYQDFIWADDVRIDRVQICEMGARKIADQVSGEVVDERYEVVAEKTM